MSQPLDDYITAREGAILAALDLLAAERRIAEFDIHIGRVLEAEAALDVAAAALGAAVDALPQGSNRIPAGWDGPAALSGAILIARHRVAKAALRCLSAQYGDESADADAEAEYAEEQLALAARNLAADAADADACRAADRAAS